VSDAEQARERRAAQLREEIDALKEGRTPKPDSPREFTDQEAEAAEHEQAADEEVGADDA
jgi:hypothetical protein